MVIYNGSREWRAPLGVAELFADMPGGLRAYRPEHRYFLLDEGRASGEELERKSSGLAVQLVRLERARSLDEVRAIIKELIGQLADPRYLRLRRVFTIWLHRVVLRRMSIAQEVAEFHDLMEVNTMLEERVPEWEEAHIRRGMAQGMAQGRSQGIGLVLQDALETRFGRTPQTVLDYLATTDDAEALRRLNKAAWQVETLDEFLALLGNQAS